MTIRISREESTLTVPISLYRIDDNQSKNRLATATAFLWEHDEVWYLITNLHNASGWNWEENRACSRTGGLPTHLDADFLIVENSDSGTDSQMMRRRGFQIPLIEDHKPTWLVHPQLREKVDVCAIPLCSAPTQEHCIELGIESFRNVPTNRHQWDQFDLHAGHEVFVLGYPLRLHTMSFPIWKRASIATEPDIDIDGLPKFLIDTATRKGMSGSPVICVNRGLTMPTGKFDNSSIFGEATRFAGIYSARIGGDELEAQLGVVWKDSVIAEIVAGATLGKLPHDG